MSKFAESAQKQKRSSASATTKRNAFAEAQQAVEFRPKPQQLTTRTILQLQRISGNKAVQRLLNQNQLIQRDIINDAAGTPIAYEFRVGTELQSNFVTLAKRLTRDGALNDSDIRQLRSQALRQRGTLNDHERMFLAGLLDPANVGTLAAARSGAAVQFPIASISPARRNYINNLDRALPESVEKEIDDLQDAWESGDAIGVMNELAEIEAASAQAILDEAGAFRTQAVSLLNFINANNIHAAPTLSAMVQAASDNSRGDRVLAGIVYAIASHSGHPFAPRIAAGDIKVDALVPTALAALPGFSGREEAAYVTVAQGGGAKGDTMYVKTTLDPTNTMDRSTVIHELQHAVDDDASNAGGNVTFPIRNQLEANAYRKQATYIYDQLDGQAAAEQAASATEVGAGMNQALAVALVLEGVGNSARNRPLFNLINSHLPAAKQLTPAQVTSAFGQTAANLEALLLQVINSMYGFTNTDVGATDGLAGESILDWVNRN